MTFWCWILNHIHSVLYTLHQNSTIYDLQQRPDNELLLCEFCSRANNQGNGNQLSMNVFSDVVTTNETKKLEETHIQTTNTKIKIPQHEFHGRRWLLLWQVPPMHLWLRHRLNQKYNEYPNNSTSSLHPHDQSEAIWWRFASTLSDPWPMQNLHL